MLGRLATCLTAPLRAFGPRVPERPFGRRVFETMQQVLDYKNPVRTSTTWQQFDEDDRRRLVKRFRFQFSESRRYHRLQNLWKDNLIAKKKRRERRLQRLAEKVPAPPGPTKLVVHSPLVRQISVTESLKQNSFAVVALNGRQYKVVTDDLLRVDQLKNFGVGDVVEADKVLLVGTRQFTLVGRPLVDNAKVVLVVEAQTKSRKLIVFKKKRRKGYRRSFGHRSLQSFLRVHRIEYSVPAEMSQRAVGL